MNWKKEDELLVLSMINVVWQSGGVREPQVGAAIEDLRRRIVAANQPVKPVEGQTK